MEIKVNVKDGITPELKKIQRQLDALPAQALKEFVNLTPKNTGNARRKTRLKGNDTISANYPYATKLDEGSSKQAPDGMTKPFFEWLDKKLKQILG
jgi:hypothetical protein